MDPIESEHSELSFRVIIGLDPKSPPRTAGDIDALVEAAASDAAGDKLRKRLEKASDLSPAMITRAASMQFVEPQAGFPNVVPTGRRPGAEVGVTSGNIHFLINESVALHLSKAKKARG